MIGLKNRTPQHIGFLVHDVGSLVPTLSDTWGLRISNPRELVLDENVIDVGEQGRLKVVLAEVGQMLFEFIQPIGDAPNCWTKALTARGPGIHHVAYSVFDEYEATIEDCKMRGFEQTVAGHFGSNHWCYLESNDLVIELANSAGPSINR